MANQKRSLRRHASRLIGVPDEDRPGGLTNQQADAWAAWSKDPWAFLSGTDPITKRPLVWTKDERDTSIPVKPFPKHLRYLRDWIDLLHDRSQNSSGTANIVLLDKPRQMYVSTASLLFMLWLSMFRPGRRSLLSKLTEGEAIEMLRDKVRFPAEHLPPWIRSYCPVPDKPAAEILLPLTGSVMLALAENAAERDLRGGTASMVLVDEAARQGKFADIVQAAIPMASLVVAVTTAQIGNPGAIAFKDYLNDSALDAAAPTQKPTPGFAVRRTRRATVCELDYWADPARDTAWLDAARAAYPSTTAFRRELLRDWTSAAGMPFYPEFVENPSKYLRHFRQALLDLPVLVGWDFGYRRPAVVFGQYSPTTERLWWFRELTWPIVEQIDTHNLRDLVRFLRAEIPLEELIARERVRALQIVNTLKERGPVPWFAPGTRFLDFSGPEAYRPSAAVEGQAKERTDYDVLAAGGVQLSVLAVAVSSREEVVRRLLATAPDGTPRMLIDPTWCPTLAQGMAGGIAYPKPTQGNPNPGEPHKDGYFEHIHDAIGYVATQVVPKADELARSPAHAALWAATSEDAFELEDTAEDDVMLHRESLFGFGGDGFS